MRGSFETATKLYATLFVASGALVYCSTTWTEAALIPRGFLGVFSALLGAMAGANVVALLMTKVLINGMAWYSREWFCVLLYGPPAMIG